MASQDLRDHLQGFVAYSDDETPRLLARSSLGSDEIARILPARNPQYYPVLGSKVGLADVCALINVLTPRQATVRSMADLTQIASQWPFPFLVKAPFGGGGAGIRFVRSPMDLDAASELLTEPDGVLAQELAHGQEVGVDALFVQGRLVGWSYAEVITVTHEFGPSTVREYLDPPVEDFVESLMTLGGWAQWNGFFNCTFIRESSTGKHLLIEADPRTNAWLQFGPKLGVDWKRLLLNPPTEPSRPFLSNPGTRMHLFPRDLAHVLRSRRFSGLAVWLDPSKGLWVSRNRADAAVNSAESRQLLGELAIRLLQPAWRALPPSITMSRQAVRAKSWALALLGVYWTPPQRIE